MPARAAIYLDSNAGAPLSPQVIEALRPLFNEGILAFSANPSSLHSPGRQSRRLIQQAKDLIAASIGASSGDSITLTASGTESNQTVIRSVLENQLRDHGKNHWILTPVEHDSVLEMVPWYRSIGGEVSFTDVDAHGVFQFDGLQALIESGSVALFTALWVGNETGVVADVPSLVAHARRAQCLLHLDAAQAWGKLPIDVRTIGADFLTFSGHKIGGLPGSGMIWTAPGRVLKPLIAGTQEHGRRGGTENILGAVSLGAASKGLDPHAYSDKIGRLRDRLEQSLLGSIPSIWINGRTTVRVANTISLGLEGVPSDALLMKLDLAGFALSSGSACSSGSQKPSHVLLAMGQSEAQARSTIRISLHSGVTWEMLEGFESALQEAVQQIRRPA